MESHKLAPLKVIKEQTVKEDGRRLIYFTFGTSEALKAAQPDGDTPNNTSTPPASTGEQRNV